MGLSDDEENRLRAVLPRLESLVQELNADNGGGATAETVEVAAVVAEAVATAAVAEAVEELQEVVQQAEAAAVVAVVAADQAAEVVADALPEVAAVAQIVAEDVVAEAVAEPALLEGDLLPPAEAPPVVVAEVESAPEDSHWWTRKRFAGKD